MLTGIAFFLIWVFTLIRTDKNIECVTLPCYGLSPYISFVSHASSVSFHSISDFSVRFNAFYWIIFLATTIAAMKALNCRYYWHILQFLKAKEKPFWISFLQINVDTFPHCCCLIVIFSFELSIQFFSTLFSIRMAWKRFLFSSLFAFTCRISFRFILNQCLRNNRQATA